jgi:hypothetical protein
LVIVLDSNQLRQAAPPDGPLLSLVRKLSDDSGHVLAIPQMVLDEYLGYHEHQARTEIAVLQKAARRLDKLFEQDISGHVPPIDSADAVQTRRKSIEQVFTILPTPEGAEHQALSREIRRLRPASTEWDDDKGGSGARDVVIWLTVLEAAKGEPGEVIFVTQDGDFGTGAGWHPELADETSGIPLRLLYAGISGLIDEFATSAAEPENTMALLGDPVVTSAVASSYTGPDVFFTLMSQVTAREGQTGNVINSTSPKMTPAKKLSRAHAYTVDGVTWLSVRVRWHGEKEYTISVEPAAGLGGPVVRPVGWASMWSGSVTFEVENTLLIEIGKNGQPASAGVTSSGMLQYRDFQAFG